MPALSLSKCVLCSSKFERSEPPLMCPYVPYVVQNLSTAILPYVPLCALCGSKPERSEPSLLYPYACTQPVEV